MQRSPHLCEWWRGTMALVPRCDWSWSPAPTGFLPVSWHGSPLWLVLIGSSRLAAVGASRHMLAYIGRGRQRLAEICIGWHMLPEAGRGRQRLAEVCRCRLRLTSAVRGCQKLANVVIDWQTLERLAEANGQLPSSAIHFEQIRARIVQIETRRAATPYVTVVRFPPP